jgi:hypothetical protein
MWTSGVREDGNIVKAKAEQVSELRSALHCIVNSRYLLWAAKPIYNIVQSNPRGPSTVKNLDASQRRSTTVTNRILAPAWLF